MTTLTPEHEAIVKDAIWRLATDHNATKTKIISDAIARAMQTHCRDCCCARSWEALGVTVRQEDGSFTMVGPAVAGSIPEHILALRAKLQAQSEDSARLEALLRACDDLAVHLFKSKGILVTKEFAAAIDAARKNPIP